MRWTQVTGAVAAFALLPGCAAWIGSRTPVASSYESAGRPVPSYYCYDCHGYRFLDPYYDWCAGYGFRYTWDRHPEAIRYYRQRYVRIKEQNPGYGRYRYPGDYRERRSYREPRDYATWRSGAGISKKTGPGDLKVREKDRHEPGNNQKTSRKKWGEREHRPVEQPRDSRPADGKRPGPPGGA